MSFLAKPINFLPICLCNGHPNEIGAEGYRRVPSAIELAKDDKACWAGSLGHLKE